MCRTGLAAANAVQHQIHDFSVHRIGVGKLAKFIPPQWSRTTLALSTSEDVNAGAGVKI